MRTLPLRRIGIIVVAVVSSACGSASSSSDVDPDAATGSNPVGGPSPAEMCEPPESPMVAAYDLGTGAYRWHRCGPGASYRLEAATGDSVYVRDVDQPGSDVIVIDAGSGDEREPVAAADLERSLPDDAARPATTPPDPPGLDVVGGQDDALVVTDHETGAEIWSVDDVLPYDDVWAFGDGAIFMSHRDRATGGIALRAYELESGRVRWETASAAETYPWWVADGRVFSIWTDLTVLGTATGEVLWSTDHGTPDLPGMRGVLATGNTVFVSFASSWGDGD